MRTKSLFKGSGCALVTPFKNGNPDFEAVKRITEYQIEGGTDAIIVCATTGEAPTLSDDEHPKRLLLLCCHRDAVLNFLDDLLGVSVKFFCRISYATSSLNRDRSSRWWSNAQTE